MRPLAWLKYFVACSAFVALGAHAQSATFAGQADEARGWLQKLQAASQRLNYSGTFVYQQGNQMRTSRVTHIVEGSREVEKLEILDGVPREYIRRNEEVVCYIPETQTLQVEKRVTRDAFPSILSADPAQLMEHYHVRMGEVGRVAGRDCQAIVLEPKDGLRYGHKLWADKASGLLLRAQTMNERGDVVEQIAFTEVGIGNVNRARVRPSYGDTSAWRVEQTVTAEAGLAGWSVKAVPAGFRKVSEVKRVVTQPAVRGAKVTTAGSVSSREIGQMIFSDGLAAISVFIEPGSYSRTEGTLQQGALNILGKRHGDYWVTVVGEVPAGAIRKVADSIEFTPE